MRQTRTIELGTGLFVLLGFAALFFLVTQITNREFGLGDGGYRLLASFEQVGGLKPGAPVSMSGVTIGHVQGIEYDFNEYKAQVTMRIDSRFDRIPDDSDAGIFTAGLLGGHRRRQPSQTTGHTVGTDLVATTVSSRVDPLLGDEQERDLLWLGSELTLGVAPFEEERQLAEPGAIGDIGE